MFGGGAGGQPIDILLTADGVGKDDVKDPDFAAAPFTRPVTPPAKK
jgi:hypothetical protein